MATLADFRAGLVANLSALGSGFQVSAYTLTNPTPPTAMVDLGPVEYDLAFQRGLDKWTFNVIVMVGTVSDIGSQQLLDQMMAPSGDRSIKQIVEADTTLGGVADDLRVVASSGPRQYAHGSQTTIIYLGAEWTVEVYASGV